MKKGIYRRIHCCIWADRKFNDLTDEQKLIWFHLLTNPFTLGIGIYNASLEGLAAHKKWEFKKYSDCFDAISDGLGIDYDPDAQVIYVKNFFRYNRPANPNVLSGCLKLLPTIPDCAIRDGFLADMQEYAKGWGEGYSDLVSKFLATL